MVDKSDPNKELAFLIIEENDKLSLTEKDCFEETDTGLEIYGIRITNRDILQVFNWILKMSADYHLHL